MGTRIFSAEDVLAAAIWRGELAAFRTERMQRLAAALAAEAAGLAPDAAAIEAATADFRYARDLVSAEECERWLAQRGLTFADLTTSVTRRLQAELPDAGEPAELPADAEALLHTEALLAHEFTGWSRQLAWRVALASAEHALPPDGTPAETLWSELEQRFTRACGQLTAPERRQRELGAQRLPLLQVELDQVEFADPAAAREACLCVREDGEALAAVAAANGFFSQRITAFLGELPAEWQTALLGATTGDVLTPPAEAEGALVVQLLGRREPSLDETAVTVRLDAELRRQYFGELETRHIRWLLNVEVEP